MTRTQGMASSRPQTAAAATISQTSSRRTGLRGRRRPKRGDTRLWLASPFRPARRELLALPVALALLVPAAPALAATSTGTSSTGTSGYNQKPPTPTTKTEPKKEVEPSKEASKTTPAATTEPAKETTTTPTTPTPKASTLPFTGLNLTWVVGAGVLLLGAGLSIRLALRTRSGR
jgi:cytoskeletal protein RodZ